MGKEQEPQDRKAQLLNDLTLAFENAVRTPLDAVEETAELPSEIHLEQDEDQRPTTVLDPIAAVRRRALHEIRTNGLFTDAQPLEDAAPETIPLPALQRKTRFTNTLSLASQILIRTVSKWISNFPVFTKR